MHDEAAVVRRWHRDLLTAGRLSIAQQLCLPTMEVHGPGIPPDAPRGAALAASLTLAVRAALSIEAIVADDVITSGDRVVVRWTLRGVHVGPFLDVAPTGRRVELTGIDIFRLVDGRIAELWQAYDRFGVIALLDPGVSTDWDLRSDR
jgi:hypothetical protein